MPVRDEEAALPALLAALGRQRGVAPFTTCVFLDGCGDDSEAVVRAAEGRLAGPVVIARGAHHAQPNAGRARRAAMALGEAAVAPAGLLLTTDADTVPADDWVAAAAAALAQADVVAGRIGRDGAIGDPAQGRLEAYYDALHAYRRRIDPVPWEAGDSHHFTGGANLGFRAAAYAALGGFPPLASGEDAAIVDEAMRAGLRVRRDASVMVTTSSRRDGRATAGLAAMLRDRDRGGAAVAMVAHPADAAWQYQAQALARSGHAAALERRVDPVLAALIGLSSDHVIGVARDCPNGEAFAMRLVPARPRATGLVPLAEAEAALAALTRDRHADAA